MSLVGHHRHVLETYRHAFNVLTGTADMTPRNPDVNSSLGAFVRAVLDCTCHDGCALLADESVQAMRAPMLEKLARAEFEMEKFHARPGRLDSFPYHANYRHLVREEVDALRRMNAAPRGTAIFVGSGPLPLTAIEFAAQTGMRVICVERDPGAVSMSRGVIAQYGLTDQVAVLCADGASANYGGANLVMVAALAAGKDDILRRIHGTAPRALLAVRSAEGLRTLLYDEIDSQKIMRYGYTLGGKSRTDRDIINTTLIFRPV